MTPEKDNILLYGKGRMLVRTYRYFWEKILPENGSAILFPQNMVRIGVW